jgi:hypothetical protein
MHTSTLHTTTLARTTTLLRTGTPLALALLYGLASPTAQAATVNNRICVDWDIGFTDQWTLEDETGLGPPDDIWATDDDVPARGVWFNLYEAGGTAPLIEYGYLGETGTYEGCTGVLALDTAKRYTITLQSRAKVGDDLVIVKHSTQTPQEMSILGLHNFLPMLATPINPNGIRNLRLRSAMWSDTLAAAAKTIERFAPAGSETYVVYPYGMDPDNELETLVGTGGKSKSAHGKSYIAPEHRSSRYIVAHELGHSIVYMVTGDRIPKEDDFVNTVGPTLTTCPTNEEGHNDNTVEYAAAALSEGWADYVAAATWNRVDQFDCWYRGNTVDWNGDGVANDYFTVLTGSMPAGYWHNEHREWHDCEGDSSARLLGPFEYDYTQSGGDFLGNTCGLDGITHLGNEMDWRRMFWDMTTDHGLSRGQLLDIIAEAKSDPDCWEQRLPTTPTCGPNTRMADAAMVVGGSSILANWTAEAVYNGVEP